MIDYPDDRRIAAEANRHDIPEPVLVRDLMRVVEVLNLKAKEFFSERSVLAGSMALRCFGSPRFTVYDADFSTSSQTVNPPAMMKDKLAYRDDDLEITPAPLVPHDDGGTAWDEDPAVYIMDPHETLAEKILGWCAHRQVKHYAAQHLRCVPQHRRAHRRPSPLPDG